MYSQFFKYKQNIPQCKKTEMVIFKSKQNKFEDDLKIKLCGKRLYPTENVKCLGVKVDKNLSSIMLMIFPLN